MTVFVTSVHVLVCLILIVLVLLQKGKGAEIGAVFGGMILRMGTTLAGFVAGLTVLALPAFPLAAALLTYTALFMALEVSLWSRQDFSQKAFLA